MSTETVNQQIPAGTYAVDPVHSSIDFAVTHNGVSTFRSGFGDYDARLSGGEAPKLEGTVEVASIDIDEEQLKGHLLSPEFFDAERHPQLQFSSTELERRRGRRGCGSAASSRSAARPTRSRPAAASPSSAPTSTASARVGLSLAAAVDRRDFGLDWNAELPSGGEALDYEVAIAVELRVRRGGRVAMRVLGISGSLRRDSLNSALLRAAAERLPAGAELVEFERLREIPPYDADVELRGRAGGGARSCARRCASADAVLIATPSTTTRSPGSSRTRSTGPRARPARAPCRASRRRRSAPRPGCSAPSGRRPRPARCSAPSAAA